MGKPSIGQRTHAVVLLVAAFGFLAGSMVVGYLAFDIWGSPCYCSPATSPYPLCSSGQCITIAGVKIYESWQPVMTIAAGLIGPATAEAILRIGSD